MSWWSLCHRIVGSSSSLDSFLGVVQLGQFSNTHCVQVARVLYARLPRMLIFILPLFALYKRDFKLYEVYEVVYSAIEKPTLLCSSSSLLRRNNFDGWAIPHQRIASIQPVATQSTQTPLARKRKYRIKYSSYTTIVSTGDEEPHL